METLPRQKRVLAVHDISCLGKCSLTVALPVLSAAGMECVCLPTAVLSTHTGGFTGYTFHDLTTEFMPIVEHWKTLHYHFDAVYTGYLGSFTQVQLVEKLLQELADEETKVYIDPVMADGGKMYPGISADFPAGMAQLCKKADVIMPNITEACMMVGEEYRSGPYEKEWIENLLHKLGTLCDKVCVLTGVAFDEENLGCAYYLPQSGEIGYEFSKRIPGAFHGTGDVFGSALVAACVAGMPLREGLRHAMDLVTGSITRTLQREGNVRYGVDFENGLAAFGQNFQK